MAARPLDQGDGPSKAQDAQARAAAQRLSREVNERILEMPHRPPAIYEIFICECCLDGCTDTVSLTTEEHGAIRRHSARFVVKPGHVDRRVERVVGPASARYEVVEKIDRGAELARDLDPRRIHDDADQGRESGREARL